MIKLLLLIATAFVCCIQAQRQTSSEVNLTTYLDRPFQNGYDKRVRPNFNGPAVDVGITIYLISMSSVSDANMDYSIEIYFRQFWNDPRLSFEPKPNLKKLVAGSDYSKRLWLPDTFFVNEKTSHIHTSTVDNEFLRILPSGDVLRSVRLSITASCPMILQYFPMDSQLCNLEMESFASTMADIRYKWNDGSRSFQMSTDVSLPEFRVIGHRQKTIEAALSTGNYSRLAVEIYLKRSAGHYIQEVYIPCSMFVILSWVSFWIDRRATTARVLIALSAILGLTFLSASVNASLSKVSYITAMDVFVGTCLAMVFLSLLEFASIGYLNKRVQVGTFGRVGKGSAEEAENVDGRLYGVRASDLDKYCRGIFPALFACFQMVYWLAYGKLSDHEVEDLVYL